MYLKSILIVSAVLVSWLFYCLCSNDIVKIIVNVFVVQSITNNNMRDFAIELHSTDIAKNKNILITGASAGLGTGMVTQLFNSGANLILPFRKMNNLNESKQFYDSVSNNMKKLDSYNDYTTNFIFDEMDLGDLNSIDKFVKSLQDKNIIVDVLVNNAGLITQKPEFTPQGYEKTFGVNFLGTAYFTLSLYEKRLLAQNATIIFVGSEEHRHSYSYFSPPINDKTNVCNNPVNYFEQFTKANNTYKYGMEAYGQSKFFLAAFSHEFAKRLNKTDFFKIKNIRCVCPGPVVSNMARALPFSIPKVVGLATNIFFQSAEKAALPILWLALSNSSELNNNNEINWQMGVPSPSGNNASDERNGGWIMDGVLSLMKNK